MTEVPLLNEPYAVVKADKTVPCIIVQLNAFANREQFKTIMNTGLAYYKAHSQPKQRWGWIADTRNMSAISQEIQQWLANDWNKQAYEAGLREMSIVSSTNVLGRIATQQYAQQAVAQPASYLLEPVYYESLAEAKAGVTQRCAVLSAQA